MQEMKDFARFAEETAKRNNEELFQNSHGVTNSQKGHNIFES
jgi:hypothetical protein